MKLKILNIVNSIVLSISFVVLTFLLLKLDLLPFKYFLFIIAFIFLLVIIILYFLLSIKFKPKTKWIMNIISFIFSLILIFISSYLNITYHFLNDILAKEYEYKSYDVIVNKNSNYLDIYNLENKEINYLSNEKYYHELKEEINQDIEFKEVKCNDISDMINSILNKKETSIILEDAYYNLIKEEYEEFNNNTKVIARYKIKVEKDKRKNNIDVKTKPFIIYISGIDTYEGIGTASRSDVNIVVTINPDKQKILLLSIPRDYYVTLHNTSSKDKLTHAGLYGIDMSEKTIEDLLEIDINYYIKLNFSTLTKSIDVLDGIDVYSDRTFTPWTNKKITINEGINHMDGKMALAFARERKIYETGDRHRGENQQAIISSMINKMIQMKYLIRYKEILKSLDGTFETDMTYNDITKLVKLQVDKNIKWDIESISLNGTGTSMPTYSMGHTNLYVMIPDQNTISIAKDKIYDLTKMKK